MGAGLVQCGEQIVLCNVGRAGELRLVAVGLEGQPIELLADAVAVGIQVLGQAGLSLLRAVGAHMHFHALPLVKQHIDGLVVQLFALLR